MSNIKPIGWISDDCAALLEAKHEGRGYIYPNASPDHDNPVHLSYDVQALRSEIDRLKADGPHELEVNGVRYRMIFDPMIPPGEVRIAAGPTPEQQATIRIDPETGCDGTDDCPCTACVEGREYHANR